MPRKSLLALCAGLPLALSAAALALPPILDRVPQDAMVVVTIPSVQDLDKDIQALTAAAKLPVPAMASVQQLLAMQGLDQAIDATRPAALFIKGWTDVEEEAPFVALIPVKDYEGLMETFGAEEQDGINAMRPGGGQKLFSRKLDDGYAAIGPALEQIQNYQGQAGNAGAYGTMLGADGEKVVDESNVAVIVNAQAAAPLIEQFITVMEEQMAMNMGMPGMEMPKSPAADWVRETVSRDAQVYVTGLNAGATGASFDFVVRFKPDSYMAGVVSDAGNASTYLSRLPKQQYLLAFAVDVAASPKIKQFLKDFSAKAEENPAAKVAPDMLTGQIERTNGFAYMIGAPVAIMMPGGLFANAVGYIATDDPAAYIEGVQQTLTQLNGQVTEGLTYTTQWQPDAVTVDEVGAAGWTVQIAGDESNPAAPQIQMLLGPGGLNGYIAPAEGGVVQTYSKNSTMLGSALDAAKQGQGLGTDPLTERVAEGLPTGRILEGYLGTQSIYQMVSPLISMQTGVQLPAPAELPPVGFGVAAGDGAAHARLFIPAPVIEAGAAVGMSIQQGQQNFDQEEDDDSGQPDF